MMQFIKQHLNLKAYLFLNILIYHKHTLILRYKFSQHFKTIHTGKAQKCQNHKKLRVKCNNPIFPQDTLAYDAVLSNQIWL